jgi:hypothetical protein
MVLYQDTNDSNRIARAHRREWLEIRSRKTAESAKLRAKF